MDKMDKKDIEKTRIEELAKDIVHAHREGLGKAQMVDMDSYPMPGEYVITGLQAGNVRGEKGWRKYIGYVAQVRLKAGAYGTDMIFLRHPDGSLMTHENQCFYRPVGEFLDQVKRVFPSHISPDNTEDYTRAYSIGGDHPRAGAIIEPEGTSYSRDPGPMVEITMTMADESKIIMSV